MSSSIVKFIDASLMPAVAMVVGKFLGLYLAIWLFQIDWQVNFGNGLMGTYPVVFEKDIRLISTFSDSLLLLFLITGLSILVFQSIYFHNTHIHPSLLAKLVRLNLLDLIKDSYRLYIRTFVWSIFCVISNIIVIINVIDGKTDILVPVVSSILTIVLIVLFMKDVEYEMEQKKKNLTF